MPTPSDAKQGELFSQLVLLLVNIIQGIALSILGSDYATKLFGSDPVPMDLLLRIVAALLVIWLITFGYAVFYIALWPPTSGASDILIIMVTGLFEYVMIQNLADPSLWMGLIALMAVVAVFSYAKSHFEINAAEAADVAGQNRVALARTKRSNLISLGLTILFALSALALWKWGDWFEGSLGYVASIVVIVYCSYILWQDTRLLRGLH